MYDAFLYQSTGIFITATVSKLHILEMYDLFEVAVKAYKNALFFFQSVHH
jgi:hypothetical protein